MTLNQGAHRANPETAAQTATGTSVATARVIPFVRKTVPGSGLASMRHALALMHYAQLPPPPWRKLHLTVHVVTHATDLSVVVGFARKSTELAASRDTSNTVEVSHG